MCGQVVDISGEAELYENDSRLSRPSLTVKKLNKRSGRRLPTYQTARLMEKSAGNG